MLEHNNTSNDSLNPKSKDTKNEAMNQTLNQGESNSKGEFSFYKAPIKNTKPKGSITLINVYNLLVSAEYENQTRELRSLSNKTDMSNYKGRNLDYVTFHGVFIERADSKLIDLSGFFSIDLDSLGENLNAVKNRLILDKVLCPQLVFTSPSGNGLKVIVKIDPSIVDAQKTGKIMDKIWQAINCHFSKSYDDIIKPNEKMEYIDSACKDVSRACFLCHDSEAYFNENSDNILGQNFIDQNISIEIESKLTQNKSNNWGVLDTNKVIESLANKHLMNNGNHYSHLLAFVGATLNSGISKESVELYIQQKVHIAEDSSCKNYSKIKTLIDDLYLRYNTDTEGVIYLTELEFAYKFIKFKYTPLGKQFVPSSINVNGVKEILHIAGFMKRKIGNNYIYIQKLGIVIKEVTPEDMRDYMTKYVYAIEEDFSFAYKGKSYKVSIDEIREIYLKNSNTIFNKAWLEHLEIHNEPILKDTKDKMFFVFNNSLIIVSKEGVNIKSLEDIVGCCIWADSIVKHEFTVCNQIPNCHYYDFLKNITNNNVKRLSSIQSCIGYLLHHYFNENEGQAIILYDEVIADIKSPMGGTGKGLIVKAVNKVRKVTRIDGKTIDNKNRFRWGLMDASTQIVCIDDIRPDFDFQMLFSNLTEGWTIESKHKPQFVIPPIDSPKTIITANTIINGEGNSNKRRKFEIELSPYYSNLIKSGVENPIRDTHGCIFFSDDWSSEEWNMFYNVLLNCAVLYLQKGLIPYTSINIEKNLLRQSTNDEFVKWIETKNLEINTRYGTKALYSEFMELYYDEKSQIGQRNFTDWLKKLASSKKWQIEIKQSNGISYFMFKK